MAKIKDKERILKAAREKQSQLQRKPHKVISRFLSRNFAGQKGGALYVESLEREKSAT